MGKERQEGRHPVDANARVIDAEKNIPWYRR